MKQIINLLLLAFSVFILAGCSDGELSIDDITNAIEQDRIVITESVYVTEDDSDTEEESIANGTEINEENEYGSTGALADDEFTLEEMLLYAIQDEYAARQEYDYILNSFDVTKPFSNIILSEETHISYLIPLFTQYNVELPADTSSEHIVSVTSLEEAFNIGVYAEIMNISMYNLFLEQDNLPDDVRDVFIKLRDASENHLQAFEKNAAKY